MLQLANLANANLPDVCEDAPVEKQTFLVALHEPVSGKVVSVAE